MYRPWGNLSWVLERCLPKQWSLLGCLGTEVRSLACWQVLHDSAKLHGTRLMRVSDGPSRYRSAAPFAQEARKRLTERNLELIAKGGSTNDVEDHELLEPHDRIVTSVDDFMNAASSDVVLDITSLPKRFFFPAIKRILQNPDVRNLIVTYTMPQLYPRDVLALNHNGWAHLPLFSGDTSITAKLLVAGVGFEPLGLPEQLEHGSGLPVKLLLPFPASPLSFQRSWDLIRKLKAHRTEDMIDVYRVEARNVSDAFDRLLMLTNNGEERTELAPFGPKPISVAMCLFSLLTNTPVFYTQPTAYHPSYSLGVSEVDGVPEIYAYCIKLEGRHLYALT